MNVFTYEKLRQEQPHLALPAWKALGKNARKKAKHLNRTQLIGNRAAKLLSGLPIFGFESDNNQ